MTKDEANRIGQCLWCISCGISDEAFQNIKPWLEEVSEIAKRYAEGKGEDEE